MPKKIKLIRGIKICSKFTNKITKVYEKKRKQKQNPWGRLTLSKYDIKFKSHKGENKFDFTKIRNFHMIKDTINQPGGKGITWRYIHCDKRI